MWEECKDLKEQINQTEDILDEPELGTRTPAKCVTLETEKLR